MAFYAGQAAQSSAYRAYVDLTDVIIPNGVTEIGFNAFGGCIRLTSVAISNSVTTIGDNAFGDCTRLASVVIPGSVTEIGKSAFEGCTGLTSVVISDGVTEIGDYAFAGCTGLDSIVIPDSVTKIGYWAFVGCTGLTSVVISKRMKKIMSDSFHRCTSLTTVTIPDGVTEIEDHAFTGCTGLTSIVIADSVTKIGLYAFDGCPNLKEIHASERIRKMMSRMTWQAICNSFKDDFGGFHRLSAFEATKRFASYLQRKAENMCSADYENMILTSRRNSLENDANRSIRISVFPDHDCDDIFFLLEPQFIIQRVPIPEEIRRRLKCRAKWQKIYQRAVHFSVHAEKTLQTNHLDKILKLTNAILSKQGIRNIEPKKWYCKQREVWSRYAIIPCDEIEGEQQLLKILSDMKAEYDPVLKQIRAFYPKAGEKRLRFSHHALSERTKKKHLPPDGQPLS